MNRSNSGFGLLDALVSLSVLATLTLGVARLVASAGQGQTSIRQNTSFETAVEALRVAFRNRGSCAATGLVGVTVNPANPTSVPTEGLNLHTPDGTITFQEGGEVEYYVTTAFRFETLALLQSAGGIDIYFAKMRLRAEPRNSRALAGVGNLAGQGQNMGTLSRGREFYLKVDVENATNEIVSCYSTDSNIYRHPKECENTDPTCNLWRSCTGEARCAMDPQLPAPLHGPSMTAIPSLNSVRGGPPTIANKFTLALCPPGMKVLSCNVECQDSYGLEECTAFPQSLAAPNDACFSACISNGIRAANTTDHGPFWDAAGRFDGTFPDTSSNTGNYGCNVKHKVVFTCTPI